MKQVLDSEEGIACESKCSRWFHRACANISKADYTQLSKDTNKKWFCNRVDCVPLLEDPIVVLTSSLNKLMNKIDSWSDQIAKITEVTEGIGEIKTDIGLIKEQISKLEPRVSANEAKIDDLISAVESIKEQKSINPESIISEVNDRSQRAKNAIIHGIPEPNGSDVRAKVEQDNGSVNSIFQSLNLSNLQVSKVIRIGKQSPDKSRPVK
jgi:seryl-tRNA synthetase